MQLVALPFVIGLFGGYLLMTIFRNMYNGNIPLNLKFLIADFFFFSFSLSGLVMIVRKEVPAIIYPIRDLPAVIIGILWVAFFWFLILGPLLSGLLKK